MVKEKIQESGFMLAIIVERLSKFLKMGKTVTGVDIASEMLNLAKVLCKKEVPVGLIKFINGNYTKVELSEKHDAAVLMGLFDYIENPQPLLKKLKKDINNI